ncbi:MAG: O-methyltransferase [Candidatus Eiseniibacteriota bacterium]
MELTESLRDQLSEYVCTTFAPEDDVLKTLVPRAQAAGLPAIQVSSEVGQLLHILVRAIGARNVLEIGTLGGYSGIWMVRALPADGKLLTLEIEPAHATFAREQFERAGLAERVDIRLGPALFTLRAMPATPAFDFAFIDADKTGYPDYLEEVLPRMRPGGIIAADNVLHMTSWEKPIFDRTADQPALLAIRKFNERLATDPRLRSVIVPMRDGVAIALVAR